jgi:predicted Zn-dependent protease
MKKVGKNLLNKKAIQSWLLVLLLSTFCFGYAPQFADNAKNIRIRWKSKSIKIGISTSMLKLSTNFKADTDISGAISRSIKAWENVANIEFVEVATEKQTVTPKGANGDGVNIITIAATPENLLLFSDNPTEIAARTRVFFHRKGHITEADIVLNPYQTFSSDGTFGTFDLESTITHEIGHLLGLDHSVSIGSTMQANQPKNGIYGMPSFVSRTLAADDITSVRGLYGSAEATDCCGSISGKIASKNQLTLCLLDSESGQLETMATSKPDGSFRIDGLPSGTFKLLAQDKKLNSSFVDIGEFSVQKHKNTLVDGNHKFLEKSFNVPYIGFNSQLSQTAIPINAGKTYTIFIGGTNFDAKNVEISFDSKFLFTKRTPFVSHDFGNTLSVMSFEISVSADTPQGDYSIKVKHSNGNIDYLLGGLSVDSGIDNSWNNNLVNINDE